MCISYCNLALVLWEAWSARLTPDHPEPSAEFQEAKVAGRGGSWDLVMPQAAPQVAHGRGQKSNLGGSPLSSSQHSRSIQGLRVAAP